MVLAVVDLVDRQDQGGLVEGFLERARALAYRAHAGQVDKAGRPYIEHVARVAAAVSDDPEAEAAAWLHDVLEDCPDFEDEIFGPLLPIEVRAAVVLLTRLGTDPDVYYRGIRTSSLALRVKLADIADNADEARLVLLDAETAARLRNKYVEAREALGHCDT